MVKARIARTWQALRNGWKRHLVTLMLAWFAVVAVDTWRSRDLPRGPAPDATLLMASGAEGVRGSSPATLEQWRAQHPGRAVALHFWAEWCPVCKLEEPSVAAIAADWPVLGIAMQSGDAGRVGRIQQQRAMRWPSAVDPQGTLSRAWGVQAVPALVVIDAHGRIRFSTTGYTPEWAMRLRLWWAQVVPSRELPHR